MSRPRLLDLFCGAGGAGEGYRRAGFDVVGVDVEPQPDYPFEFIQTDALMFSLEGFDAVHASPPCHDHSTISGADDGTGHLLGDTIELVKASGLPWVVENVVSPSVVMDGWYFTLCGSMFGMQVRRHRRFGASFMVLSLGCNHRAQGRPWTITEAARRSTQRSRHRGTSGAIWTCRGWRASRRTASRRPSRPPIRSSSAPTCSQRSAPVSERLAELLARSCEALETAADEIETIAESDEGQPIPDDLQRILDEHAAMRETLKRLRDAAYAGKPITGRKLDATYKDATASTHGTYELPAYPVMPEVRREIEDAREELRRAALTDPDVRAALDSVRHEVVW